MSDIEVKALPELLRMWKAPWHLTHDGIKSSDGCWIMSATNARLAEQLVELANHAADFDARIRSAIERKAEPVGYCSEYGLSTLATKAHHYYLSVSKKAENEFQFPIFSTPPAAAVTVEGEPVAWLRHGEEVPVQNVPFGAMWISDKDDPRAFPVYATPPQVDQARAEKLEDALRHITLVRDEVSDERFRAFALSTAHAALSASPSPPAAPVTVPEGWQLVPKEPTEEMLDAYWHQTGESKEMRARTHAYMRRYYSAMLSASPEPARESREGLIEALKAKAREVGPLFIEDIDEVVAALSLPENAEDRKDKK